jgi:MFS family permease
MLKVNVDLSAFGIIKGLMYFLPAISYLLLAPWLQRKQIDREVCIFGYLLRVSLPCLLPILALLTSNAKVLTIACMVILPISMMLATFANNSLMVIYRQAIPPETFNKCSNTMMMLLSLPGCIAGVPVALFIDIFDKSSTRTFCIIYALLALICVLFELPAIKAMRKVKLDTSVEVAKKEFNLHELIAPYKDKNFFPVVLITLLHGIICGSLGAYLIVYLMLAQEWKMSLIAIMMGVIGLFAYTFLPYGGKLTDRFGFAKIFFAQAILTFLMMSLLCLFWNNLLVLILFLFLVWDTATSIIGSWMGGTEIGATSKLSVKGRENYYVSAYNLCRSGGLFLGSFLAMPLYKFCVKLHGAENYSQIFRSYFSLLIILIAVLLLVATSYLIKSKNIK